MSISQKSILSTSSYAENCKILFKESLTVRGSPSSKAKWSSRFAITLEYHNALSSFDLTSTLHARFVTRHINLIYESHFSWNLNLLESKGFSMLFQRRLTSVTPTFKPADIKSQHWMIFFFSSTRQKQDGSNRSSGSSQRASRKYSDSSLSRPSSSSACELDPKSAVDPVRSNLGVFEIDKVKDVLREALEVERQALMEDICFLQVIFLHGFKA